MNLYKIKLDDASCAIGGFYYHVSANSASVALDRAVVKHALYAQREYPGSKSRATVQVLTLVEKDWE